VVLLAVGMVADVTRTRGMIPGLEFRTCMTIKFQVQTNDFILTYLSGYAIALASGAASLGV